MSQKMFWKKRKEILRNETTERGKWETENVKGKTARNMDDEKHRRTGEQRNRET